MKRKLKGTEGLYIESKNRTMDVNLLDQVRIKVQIGALSGIPTDSTGQTTIDSTSSDFVVGLQFNVSWIDAATQADSTTTAAMSETLYAASERGSVVFDTITKKLVTFSEVGIDSNGDPTDVIGDQVDWVFTIESIQFPTTSGIYVGTASERGVENSDVVFTCKKVTPAMPPLQPNPTISLTYLTSEKAISAISSTADSIGHGSIGNITDSEDFILLPNYTYGSVYYRTKAVNIAWSTEMSIFSAYDRKALAYHGYFKAAVNYAQAQGTGTTFTTTVSLPSDISYRSSTAPTFSDGHIYRWDIEDGKIWFTDLGTSW